MFCLVNCKATQESNEGKEVYCVAVFGSKLQLKKEVNRPSVSVKPHMFFLSLETSAVAFRTVLDELLCFFLALNLTSFQYFCQESFFFAFLFAFQRIFAPKFPAKIPRNRPFSPRICLFKSREISLFPPRIIRSPDCRTVSVHAPEKNERLLVVYENGTNLG